MAEKIHPQKLMIGAVVLNDINMLREAMSAGADWELTEDGKPGDYAQGKANSPWWFNAAQMSLHKMFGHGGTEIVRHLQEQGVDFAKAAEQLIYPNNLVNSLSPHNSGDALELILDMWPTQWGPWQDWRQKETGFSLLHLFAKEKERKKIQVLLEGGADPNAVDRLGRTPLHLAKTSDNVLRLLEGGADLRIVDKHGATPLYTAVKNFRIKYREEKGGLSPLIAVCFAPVYSLAANDNILKDPKARTIARILKSMMTEEFVNRTNSVYNLGKITHQIDAIFAEVKSKKLAELSQRVRSSRNFKRQQLEAGVRVKTEERVVPKF